MTVTTTVDNVAKVLAGIELMLNTRVMVGVPADTTGRREGGPINNAALAYIHENGAPEANIPPRPFLGPAIKEHATEIADGLKKVGELALAGKPDAVERQFHRIGTRARDAVKRKITDGPFEPLKPATIAARRRRSPGSKYRRKAVTAADVKPLIDTGQLRNAINYVIKKTR